MDTEALDGLWAIADALVDLRCDSDRFDGLDLSRDREDSRTPFSGDKFSAVREVAETEGFSFREVQRRLRESKLKSRATGSVTEVSKLKSRGTGSVTEVEQYRNDIVGDVENILPSPCRIKKATEGGPLATDAHGAKCSLNNCLHQPHYTSPDSPPLVTSFTSAAITPLSDAIEAAALAAALAESALGSS